MRTRSISCKPKSEPKINPRWVACWVTLVFYKLLLKLKKWWVHIPASNSIFENAPDNLKTRVQMKYQQGDRNLCLIKSFASALFYICLKNISGQINSQSNGYEHLLLDKEYKTQKGHENIYTNDLCCISL